MYVNIGEDLSIRTASIVGVFDYEKAIQSKRSRRFLARAEEEGTLLNVGGDPKAIIVTTEFGMERVYLTQLGPAALERRMKESD